MNTISLTIATRESPLALWQANWVKSRLQQLHPGLNVRLLGLSTTADKLSNVPLRTIGGKDLFVKELEEALLAGRADLAVHSMKDVPMHLPSGLSLPVICERDDPRDAFVSNQYHELSALPDGATVGTSSLRRQSQLYAAYPTLECLNVRGNVGTRLARLDRGDFAALVLAASGLKRLNLEGRITTWLPIDLCLPAAGQGALGIECREADHTVQAIVQLLNHPESAACVRAERAMCRTLGAGCQVPIGAYAEKNQDTLRLRGVVAWPDGRCVLRAEAEADWLAPEALGAQVAADLLQQGAAEILTALETPHG